MQHVRIDVKRYHLAGDAWPIILAYMGSKPIYRKQIHRPRRPTKKSA